MSPGDHPFAWAFDVATAGPVTLLGSSLRGGNLPLFSALLNVQTSSTAPYAACRPRPPARSTRNLSGAPSAFGGPTRPHRDKVNRKRIPAPETIVPLPWDFNLPKCRPPRAEPPSFRRPSGSSLLPYHPAAISSHSAPPPVTRLPTTNTTNRVLPGPRKPAPNTPAFQPELQRPSTSLALHSRISGDPTANGKPSFRALSHASTSRIIGPLWAEVPEQPEALRKVPP